MQQHRSAYNMRNAHSAYSTHSAHNTGLSHLEQEMLIKSFPNEIKFSYEKSTHKKVLSDLYVIIPKGRKYFVWFTHHNRKNICLFLEICNRTHNILNVFYRYVSFHDTLSYGTIFYGTLFRQSQGQDDIFSVENIYYYKGQSIQDYTYESKLKTIKDIFDTGLRYNTRFQFHPSQKSVVFGIPVIATSFDEACKVAEKLPYAVYSIQYRHLNTSDATEYYLFGGGERSDRVERSERKDRNDNNIKIEIIEKPVITEKPEVKKMYSVTPYHISANTNTNTNTNANTRLFYIKPDIQNDIYYLYDTKAFTLSSLATTSIISKNIAHIPDYKTSVLMNKLFRNIKENRNLDALEESDEEEEFENIQIDKFVDLNKVLKMRCNFNYKFQAWVPVQVVE
jgi:hypothetical protein